MLKDKYIAEAAERIMNEQDDDDDDKMDALGDIEVALDEMADDTLWGEMEKKLETIRKMTLELRNKGVKNLDQFEAKIVMAMKSLRSGVDAFGKARSFFKKSVE